MAIEQKKNDWLATNFFSPDKSFEEFAALGITPDNSSLQNEDYYTKLPDIQEAFKTDSGDFDSAKFHKYYQEILSSYNSVEAKNLDASLLDFYEYDPNNYFAPKDGKVADVAPRMVQFANPDRRSRGLTNLNEISAPTMSAREVAQQNRVFNVETGEFEDWTPNDWGGLSAITRPALVLAQWDEDGFHEVDGRQVKHSRGDLKYNEFGDTYYETLGKRNLAGKDILHISDTLSVDGSKWNKYDFFDSDGIDKSVAGTIAKTVTKMIPMFIPYGVGTAYGAMTAALELGKTFPALYKAVLGIATGDLSNSKSAQKANEIEAWFSKFDSSTSDKGKDGFFTLENLGTVIADSSKQLFQQRTLAKIPKLLSKGNITDKTMKWGKGISLAYMAATSTTDSYDAFKEAGANDRVAGLGMLASGLAMYGLMQGNYFGITDHMFRDTYLDKGAVTNTIKTSAKKIVDDNINKYVATPKAAANWVLKTADKIKSSLSKLKANDLMSDSLAEGTEEVLEEISGDAVKGFFKGLNALGLIDKQQEYDFGFSVQDMASRYGTAFAGGAIGGAVFHLQGKYENWFNTNIRNKKPLQMAEEDPDSFKSLIYLFQQGKGAEARAELEKLHRKGKLGSVNLSGTDWDYVKDDKGNLTIKYKAAQPGASQNDIVYQKLSDYFDWVENTMIEEGLNLSEEDIEEAILYNREVFDVDINAEQARNLIINNRMIQSANSVTGVGVHTQIFEDWNERTAEILKTKAKLEEMLSPKAGENVEDKSFEAKKEALKNNAEYKRLNDKLKTLRQEQQDLLSGKKSDYYFGQWQWILQPKLAGVFMDSFGKTDFIKKHYNKTYEELTEEERNTVDKEYAEYSKTKEKQDALRGYDRMYNLQEKLGLKFEELANKMKEDLSLFDPKHSVYTWRESVWNNRLQEIERELQELTKKLDSEPENIDTINDQISDLNLEKQGIEQAREEHQHDPKVRMLRALSEQGRDILQRPIWNSHQAEFDEYVDSYLEMLNTMNSKNLYSDGIDSDLENILLQYTSQNIDSEELLHTIVSKTNEFVGGELVNETNPQLNGVITAWGEIATHLKNGDFSNAVAKYNGIKSMLAGEGEISGYVDDLDSFLKEIFPKVGNVPFIDFITKVQQLKATSKQSPVYDIIPIVNQLDGNSENLINTLDEQILQFLRSDTTDDYFIKDPKVLERLKRLRSILLVSAGIADMHFKDGFNDKVNVFREALGKQRFGSIDRDVNILLKGEIERLLDRTNTLIKIAKENEARALGKQMSIELNMRDLLFNDFVNPSSLLYGNISRVFHIDLEDLLNKSGYDANDTPDKKLAAQIKFETLLYTTVSEKATNEGWSEQDLAEKVVDCFNQPLEIIKGKPTKLSDGANTVVSEHDKFVHLVTILSVPSQNFHSVWKQQIEDAVDIAPVYAQEYSVRVMWSKAMNPKFYDFALESLIKRIPENASKYLKTKSILGNVHVYGGAGVGKSRGSGKWIKNLLPNATFITCAPLQTQVDNLNSALDHSGVALTADQLLRRILDRKVGEPTWSNKDVVPLYDTDGDDKSLISAHLNANTKISSDAIVNNTSGGPTILVIDEVGVFNRVQLEAISKWAKKHNVVVFGLGDYKQNSGKLQVEYKRAKRVGNTIVKNENGETVWEVVTKTLDSGVEDCYVFYGPELRVPFRPGNAAQLDNYNAVSAPLDTAYDAYWENPGISSQALGDIVAKELDASPIKLKYFETDGNFGGAVVNTQRSVVEDVNFLKGVLSKHPSKTNNPNKICIITEDPTKHQTIEGVVVRRPDEVQGEEFDYVILDYTLGNMSEGKTKFDQLKDLYTLTQRASRGVILKQTSNILTTIVDNSTSVDIALNPQQIQHFIDWKKSYYSHVGDEIISTRDLQDKTSKPQPADPTNGNTPKESNDGTSSMFDYDFGDFKEDSDGQNTDDDNTSSTPNPKIEAQSFGTPKKMNGSSIYVNGKYFYEWWHANKDSQLNSFVANAKAEFNVLRGATNDKWNKIHKILRAYFIYGHYKESDGASSLKALLGNNIANINWDSVVDKCNSVTFEVKSYASEDGETKVLCAKVSNNLYIPLFAANLPIGEYTGDIKLTTIKKGHYWKVDTNSPIKTRITDVGGRDGAVYIYSLGEDKEHPETKLSGEALSWYGGDNTTGRSKDGQIFAVLCDDPFVSEADMVDFLNPTVEDGKIVYNTQKGKKYLKFHLAGAFKRLTTEDELNALWDTLSREETNSISGAQMGRVLAGILSHTGVTSENPIFKRLSILLHSEKGWLSSPDSAIQIQYVDDNGHYTDPMIFSTTKDMCEAFGVDTLEACFKIIASKKSALIAPVTISASGNVYIQPASFIAKGVFGKGKKLNDLSALKAHSKYLLQLQQFSEGFYLNSEMEGQLQNEVWYTTPKDGDYYTNVTTVYGDAFELTGELSETDIAEEQHLKYVRQFFKDNKEKLGFYPDVKNTASVQNAVDWVNSQIRRNVKNSPDYIQVEYSNGELSIVNHRDPKLLIENKLGKEVKSVSEIDSYSSKFQLFLVTLSNNDSWWYRLDSNGNVQEVNTSYVELLTTRPDEQPAAIAKYIKKLLAMEVPSMSETMEFMNTTSQEILDVVIKYLNEKIENGEC